jgi:hypothetical protein
MRFPTTYFLFFPVYYLCVFLEISGRSFSRTLCEWWIRISASCIIFWRFYYISLLHAEFLPYPVLSANPLIFLSAISPCFISFYLLHAEIYSLPCPDELIGNSWHLPIYGYCSCSLFSIQQRKSTLNLQCL